MPKIKYIGTADNFSELAYTGKQSIWKDGQSEFRSDAEAAQLAASGMFEFEAVPLMGRPNPVTGKLETTVGGEVVELGGGTVVSITGSGALGSVLTATLASGWTATSHQWLRDGVAISGATAATYTVQSADVAAFGATPKVISCTATGLANKATGLTINASTAVLLALESRIVYEGDSITAFETAQAMSFQYFAHIQSGAKLYYPSGACLAVGGQQIGPRGNSPGTYMADAGQIAAVVAQAPDIVHFFGGTNDIAHSDINDALIFADLQTCISGYFAGGAKYVIVGTVIPHNTVVDTGWSGAMETARLALNTRIRTLPSLDTRIKIADYAAVAWDLTAALTTYQPDGVHPNAVGVRLMANILTPILDSITTPDVITGLYLGGSNLLLASNNPQLTGIAGVKSAGTGSAPTGDVATSWSVSNNCPGVIPTCSKATLNGAEAQQIDIAGTTSGAASAVRFQTTCSYTGVAGEGYEAWCDVELSPGCVNLRSIILSCDTSNTFSTGSAYDMDSTGFSGVLRTKLVAPLAVGDVSNTFRVGIQFGAIGPVAASVKIGKPVFRKITAAAPQ